MLNLVYKTLTVFSLAFLVGFTGADMSYMPFYQENNDNKNNNNNEGETGNIDSANENSSHNKYSQMNKDFWETMYQNSMLSKKTRYDILNGGNVCFSCPIDRSTFTSLYEEARVQAAGHNLSNGQAPPKITIAWASEQVHQTRIMFFCRNNTKAQKSPIYLNGEYSTGGGGGELEYVCEDNRLCLLNVKNNYPQKYQCFVKSYVLDVKLNVVGKFCVSF